MGMVVRTNMAALGANNSLAQASKAQQNGMQKLYTGFKINAAKDDASGLAISEKMKNQIKALDTAKDNCEDGANMIQTAEGYMKETHDILTRMTELAEKAANGLLEGEDRKALQNEMDELCGEIDRMATTANFNGKKLLNGDLGSNGKVEITSDATGNHYSISNQAPDGNKFSTASMSNGTSSAGSVTGTGASAVPDDAIAELSGSAKDALLSKVSAAAEAVVNAAGDGAKAMAKNNSDSLVINIAVNKNGDVVADGLAKQNDIHATSGNLNAADITSLKNIGFENADSFSTSTAITQEMIDAVKNFNKAQSDAATKLAGSSGTDVYSATNNKDGYSMITVTVNLSKASNATKNEGIKLQIGESSTAADKMEVSIGSFHTDTLLAGINGFQNKTAGKTGETDAAAVAATKSNDTATYDKGITVDISDQNKASAAADAIRQVSNYVSDQRGKLGAQQNRLDHTVNNLATASENTTAAKSRILDTDMAKEMMEYTSKNVIAQAAQSMLAQANSQPQNVLSLLQ